MKKKILVALLAGVMMLQQPVSGWCAQNTDSAQQSETTQEGDSSEDAAAGDTEDSAAGEGTAVTEDGENGGKAADTDQDVQEEDEIATWQAETDEVTLDTGTSNNAVTGERTILDHIYLESVDLSGMTKEEAQEAVQSRVDEITGYQIILHMDDMSTGVTAKELGVTGDNDGTDPAGDECGTGW